MIRKTISKKIRFEVFKRDGFTCQYCGRMAPDVILELDHIQPISKNGEENILNYITSCFDCNRGKGNRELSDDTILKAQQNQLEELKKKREQLEMLFKWKEEIKNIDEYQLSKLCDFWEKINNYNFSLNITGIDVLRKILKKYDSILIIEAMENAYSQYVKNPDDKDQINQAFNKVEKICNWKKKIKKKPYLNDLYYIRGILKNKFYLSRITMYNIVNKLEKCYLKNYSIDYLKQMAIDAEDRDIFLDQIEFIINNEEFK